MREGHTRGILNAHRRRRISAPVVQLVMAGACRNRTYRGSCEPQLVLKTSRTTRPEPPPQELRVARPNCAPIVPTRSSGLRATCGRALVECRMLAARSEPSRLRTDSQRSKMSCVLRPVNLLLCSMFPAEARWRTGTVLGAPKRVQADFSSQGGWGARTDA